MEKLKDLIPSALKKNIKMKKLEMLEFFAGSLELVKEGNVQLKQEEIFGDIYIRNNE